jgi:hypothetical protein
MDSGVKIGQFVRRAYSYGDSAGFTPDFPFKDAIASTKIAANLH